MIYFLKKTLSVIAWVCMSSLAFGYESEYGTLLRKYVTITERDGITFAGIAYDAWAKDPLHAEAITKLKAIDRSTFSLQQKKAYWINAYNLLTIDLIIKEKETESIKNLGSFFQSPWKKYSWEIQGKSYTLDMIEHSILRKLGDPRIHSAIVCASLSCPDLSQKVYHADTLDTHLNTVTDTFLKNPQKGMRIDKNKIYISKIFDWFEEDFETQQYKGKEAAKHFILKYIRKDLPSFNSKEFLGKKVTFIPYNWSLNKY